MMLAQGKRVVYYIGFCADEPKRFKFDLNSRDRNVTQIYPLAENEINEDGILEWAKTQPIYNDYYKYNKRCGCMGCPMSSFENLIYLKRYYPEHFEYFMEKARFTEKERSKAYGKKISTWASNPKYDTDYKINRVNEIIMEQDLANNQITFFDNDDPLWLRTK